MFQEPEQHDLEQVTWELSGTFREIFCSSSTVATVNFGGRLACWNTGFAVVWLQAWAHNSSACKQAHPGTPGGLLT
jgi:hypothetical protein